MGTNFSSHRPVLSHEEIQRNYDTHHSQYWINPRVTFAHIFFSRDRHGAARAEALARIELLGLNRNRVRLDQAPSHGDRFLYNVNYVEQEAAEVASHFGEPMQKELFALEPSASTWHGPLESSYGFHLVMLTRREAGYLPPIERISAKMEQDARRALLEARFEESVQSMVKAYHIKIESIRESAPAAPRDSS